MERRETFGLLLACQRLRDMISIWNRYIAACQWDGILVDAGIQKPFLWLARVPHTAVSIAFHACLETLEEPMAEKGQCKGCG